jgi:hypothetical protein
VQEIRQVSAADRRAKVVRGVELAQQLAEKMEATGKM